LIKAFKPRDIHPCTVDPLDWDEDVSMESLFGHLCSDNKFVHDQYMREMTALENGERPRKRRRRNPESPSQSTQQLTVTENSTTSQASQMSQISMRTGREINGAVPTMGGHSSSLSLDPPPIRPTIASSSPPSPPPATMAQPLEHTYRTTNNASDNGSNSDSLPIPTLSPETAKARRYTIQQAWHYLNDAQKSQSNKFQLVSLPSSWSTNGEISGPRLSISEEHDVRELVGGFSSSQPTAIYEPIASTVRQGKPPLPTSTGVGINVDEAIDNTEPDLYHNIILETDNDNGSVNETDTEHETNQHHFSQNSISSSAFASQSQSQNQGRLVEYFEEETASEEEYISDAAQGLVDPDRDLAPALQLESVLETRNRPRAQHPFLVRRESSLRNRQAAYQAAREDNYDAWAGISLVSAGNNHTEEEIEL
jgi:DNA cross-link repair 1C protein